MKKITMDREAVVISVDMGDRWSQICSLRAADGKKLEELKVRTKSKAFKDTFCGLGRARIVIEIVALQEVPGEVEYELCARQSSPALRC